MEIAGTHFAITGSNRGIGRATAMVVAEDKAHLHLINRTQDPELKDLLLKAGAASVTTYDCDLSSRDSIDACLEKLKSVDLDILFNNAGQLTGGLLEAQTIDEIYSMFQVNVNALVHFTHGVLPRMVARKKGKIINHSSVSAVMHFPCASTYAASKAAVLAFTDCLRAELKGTGVTTLVLLTPGIETRMFNDIPNRYGKNLDVNFLGKGMAPAKYAGIIREAILEDIEISKPHGISGVALNVARHLPMAFERVASLKFKR